MASAANRLIRSRKGEWGAGALGGLLGFKLFVHAVGLAHPPRERVGRALAVIPSKKDRKTPIPHDAEMYKWRHLVENCIQRLKEWRRIATRYDKTDTSFCAFIHLSAALRAIT